MKTVELIQDAKLNPKRTVKPGMDLVRIKLALDDMYVMLTSVLDYVDKILAGKIPMDSNIGRSLSKIIDAVPILDPQTFDTLMTNQMNVRILSLFLSLSPIISELEFNWKLIIYFFLFSLQNKKGSIDGLLLVQFG